MKRIIAIILSAVLLAVAFPVITLADESTEAETVYSDLDILHKKLWKAGEGVLQISERKASGNDTVYASAKEGAETISLYADFAPKDLSSFHEICFHIAIKGNSKSYPVTLTLSSKDKSTTHRLTADNNNTVFYIPLSKDVAGSLSSVALSVDAKDSDVSYVTISNAVADNTYTYSYLSAFSATDVTSSNALVKEEKKISLIPSGNTADLSPVFYDYTESNGNTLLWLTLEKGVSGTVIATAKYQLEEDKEEKYTTLPLTANAPGSYSFIVPSGFKSASFEFMSLTDNTPISVLGTGFANIGESQNTIGSISSCRYDKKNLTVSGTISQDASLKYMGSKLLLYRIPANEVYKFTLDDLSDMKPVAQSSFSTRFSLSFETNESYASWFYKVVLETEDGLIPVGNIKSANCGSVSPGQSGSVSSLYGADAADVFEANTDSTVIDVYAGKLLDVTDIYSAVNYNHTKPYHFNSEYLKEIDESIGFFNSAGIKVYIRLFSDKEGYLFDYNPNDKDSLSIMCAVSTFLSERYSNAKGFIIATHINTQNSTTPEASEKKARLISIFAECIKSKNPSAAVIVPFLENGDSDLQLSAAMLCYYLSYYNAPAISAMYEFSDNKENPVATANRLSLIATQFGAPLDGFGIMWDPHSQLTAKETSSKYAALCKNASAYGAAFAVLNVSKLEKSPSLYDSLKIAIYSENISQISLSTFPASEQKVEFTGTYPLWDFTSSYDTKDWAAGGSFTAPVSAKGTYSQRALMSESSKNGAGILIARMNKPLNAKDSSVRFTFSISSKTEENADVSFIFGGSSARAEFLASVQCNTPVSLVCDLSDFEGSQSIEYAAVIVRNATDAKAEISIVEVCSTKLSHEEMKLKYYEEKEFEHHPLLYILVIFIAAGTVTVFSVLMKKKKPVKKDSKDE